MRREIPLLSEECKVHGVKSSRVSVPLELEVMDGVNGVLAAEGDYFLALAQLSSEPS
ncbi:MAG: hypothetical protein ACLP05_00095 [Candidatus Kryptoniota bacterium]